MFAANRLQVNLQQTETSYPGQSQEFGSILRTHDLGGDNMVLTRCSKQSSLRTLCGPKFLRNAGRRAQQNHGNLRGGTWR